MWGRTKPDSNTSICIATLEIFLLGYECPKAVKATDAVSCSSTHISKHFAFVSAEVFAPSTGFHILLTMLLRRSYLISQLPHNLIGSKNTPLCGKLGLTNKRTHVGMRYVSKRHMWLSLFTTTSSRNHYDQPSHLSSLFLASLISTFTNFLDHLFVYN